MWWSRKAKQWFTVEQINSSRQSIADTYLNYEGIGFDVDVAQAKIIVSDQTYNGAERKPLPAVVLDGKTLVNGIDYTLSYKDNVNAGTAYVVITGRGDYAGEISYPFAITPKAITVRADAASKQWGQADPELTATVDGLIEGDTISYTLLREPGEDVGEYVIAVEGDAQQGNYTATYERSTFTVTKASIDVPSPVSLVFNGQAQQGVPAGEGYALSGTVTSTNAGTYTAVATPDANHTWADGAVGAKSISWSIAQKDIAKATIGAISNQAYTGDAITPRVSASLDGVSLQEGSDFTASYSDNVKVGTATVTITGKGNYAGMASRTFKIVQASIADATITAPPAQTYAGKALTPSPTVRFGSITLTKGVDYTLAYANNTAVGTATVTITGKGSFKGSAKATFAIRRAPVTVSAVDKTKTFGAADPKLTAQVTGVVDGFKIAYTVSRDTGEDVGTYTITPSGAAEQGNYQVTFVPANLTVNRASLAKATVAVAGGSQTYTGSTITPKVTVTLEGKTLRAGTDYTVAYGSNVNAGTARVTVTGIGNYGGSASVTFTIAPATISTASVSVADASYTGDAIESDVTVRWNGRTLVSGRDYMVSYAGNVNAGTATVTVTGKGNFEGTKDGSFAIAPADIADARFSLLNDRTYTGKALTPEPTVTFEGTTLRKGVDYSLSYKNNTKMGTASVVVAGKGNFSGSTTLTFNIVAASLADATVKADGATYTGNACKPTITVTWDGKILKAGTDYTVAYGSNVNAGTGRVTITGKGNYSGTATTTFPIAAASLEDATVTVTDADYTGSEVKPQAVVTWGGKTLKAGTDYTVAYANNVNVGTATLTITGKGNFVGTKTAKFKVVAASIEGASLNVAGVTYTGSARKPAPTVTLGGKELVKGTDYSVAYANNIDVGTATVTVTGKGNYAGKATATFQIAPAPISKAKVAAIPDQVYTGKAVEPTVSVSWGDRQLVSGVDYSVAYGSNVQAGTGTVTITGKGNFTSTKTAKFKIVATSLADAQVTAVPDQKYTGKAIAPSLTVKLGGKTLAAGTDFTVAYKDNVDAGTATVTVTGKGSYIGSQDVTFKIVPADIAKATVAKVTDRMYTGAAVKPALSVTFGGMTLAEGTDFTVAYKDNVNAGVATATITGKGNYVGSRDVTFKIAPADIAKATVTAPAQVYSGKALTPSLTVSLGSRTLKDGVDFSATYESNVNAGTATVTLTGKGNYAGTAKGTFKIGRAEIDVPSARTGLTYNAKEQRGVPEGGFYTLTGAATATDAGSYAATATPDQNHCWVGGTTGAKKVLWGIAAASLDSVTVQAVKDQVYTGSALTPVPVAKLGSWVLGSGTDFTVAYKNNVNAGTATLTLKGKGNFSGTRKVTFKIAKDDVAKATVEAVADQSYTGKAIKPALAVKGENGRALVAGTDYTVAYKNNVDAGTATATITGKNNYTGTKSVTFKIVVTTQEMYRLYNPNSGEHFYTAKAGERDQLVKVGWIYEGIGWIAPLKSSAPVYRLYNPVAGDHHYTMKVAEMDALIMAGWKYEGIGWYSDDAKGVPLYRQYNPNAVTGSHNYTTSKKENDALVKIGWKAEGIGWYGVKQ